MIDNAAQVERISRRHKEQHLKHKTIASLNEQPINSELIICRQSRDTMTPRPANFVFEARSKLTLTYYAQSINQSINQSNAVIYHHCSLVRAQPLSKT